MNDLKTVAEGAGPIAAAVLANDQDIDGDTLKITAKTNGAKGTVVITGGGTGLTYDPGPLKDGMDTFTYTVSDGHGGTDIATVLVTITPDTAAPVLSGLTQSMPSQTLATNTANTVKVDLAWTASDVGSGVVSYQLQVSVDGGTYTTITLPTATTRTMQRTLRDRPRVSLPGAGHGRRRQRQLVRHLDDHHVESIPGQQLAGGVQRRLDAR